MTTEEIVGFVIVSVIALPLLAISIVLMMGRGSDSVSYTHLLQRAVKFIRSGPGKSYSGSAFHKLNLSVTRLRLFR